MLSIYTGTPGSGKSLHTISLIFAVLRQDRYVIANFPVRFSQKEIDKGYDKLFLYWTNDQITPENLILFALENGMIEAMEENQCLVIIDEAGGKFNSRDYANSDRRVWLEFFAQHRKLGYDFVLTCQNDRQLDRQIRGLVETEKRHRKVNNFRFFSILPFPLFCCVEYWYPIKQKVQAEFFLYRKKWGNKYDTMRFFEGIMMSERIMEVVKKHREGQEIQRNADFDINVQAIFHEDKKELSAED